MTKERTREERRADAVLLAREILVELAKIHEIMAGVNKRLEEKYGTTN